MARLCPSFQYVIPCQPEQTLSSFQLRLEQPECPYTGRIIQERYIILRMTPAERHYWSPVLSADAHSHSDGTLLRGYFGPHPNVWSLFIALYSAIAFGALLGCMHGFSQWLIQKPPLGPMGASRRSVALCLCVRYSNAGSALCPCPDAPIARLFCLHHLPPPVRSDARSHRRYSKRECLPRV